MNNSSVEANSTGLEGAINYCKNSGQHVIPELQIFVAIVYILGVFLNSLHLVFLGKKEESRTKNTSLLLIQITVVNVLYALVIMPGILIIHITHYQALPQILLKSIWAAQGMAYTVHNTMLLLNAIEHYTAVCKPHTYSTSKFVRHLHKLVILAWLLGTTALFIDIFVIPGTLCIMEGFGPYQEFSRPVAFSTSCVYLLLILVTEILYVKAIFALLKKNNSSEMNLISDQYKSIVLFFTIGNLLYLMVIILPLIMYICGSLIDFPSAYYSYTTRSIRSVYIIFNPVLFFITSKNYRRQIQRAIADLRCRNKVNIVVVSVTS